MRADLQDELKRWDQGQLPMRMETLMEAARLVANAEQIGWFDPGSKRFCYSDERETWPDTKQGYTIPVFTFERVTDG